MKDGETKDEQQTDIRTSGIFQDQGVNPADDIADMMNEKSSEEAVDTETPPQEETPAPATEPQEAEGTTPETEPQDPPPASEETPPPEPETTPDPEPSGTDKALLDTKRALTKKSMALKEAEERMETMERENENLRKVSTTSSEADTTPKGFKEDDPWIYQMSDESKANLKGWRDKDPAEAEMRLAKYYASRKEVRKDHFRKLELGDKLKRQEEETAVELEGKIDSTIVKLQEEFKDNFEQRRNGFLAHLEKNKVDVDSLLLDYHAAKKSFVEYVTLNTLPEMFEEAKADGRMDADEKFAQMPMGGGHPGTNAGNKDYTKEDTPPEVHPLDEMESSMGVHNQTKSFFNQKHRR